MKIWKYFLPNRTSQTDSSKAIQVMNEVGININTNHPKSVDEFLYQKFDFVITVCDDAKEACRFSMVTSDTSCILVRRSGYATGTEKKFLLFSGN